MVRFVRPNMANLVSAGIVMVLGAVSLWEGLRYPLGTAARMGAGYFPAMLGIAMLVIAVLILFEKPLVVEPGTEEKQSGIPWRGLLALTAALLVWPAMAPRFGLVTATFLMIIVVSLGNARFRPVETVINAGVVSAIGYWVFLRGFHIPLPAFWW